MQNNNNDNLLWEQTGLTATDTYFTDLKVYRYILQREMQELSVPVVFCRPVLNKKW